MSRRSNESAIGAIIGALVLVALAVAFVVYVVPLVIVGWSAVTIFRALEGERLRKQRVRELPIGLAQEYIRDAATNGPRRVECQFCGCESDAPGEHVCPRCRAPLPSRRAKVPTQEEALAWAQEQLREKGISLDTPLGVRVRVIGCAILLAVTAVVTSIVWYDIAHSEPSVAATPARPAAPTPVAQEAIAPEAATPTPTAAPEKKVSRTKRSRTKAAKASAADAE